MKQSAYLLAVTALMGVVIGCVSAENQSGCRATQSDNWCVPLLSCIGEDGLWFKGQTNGRRSGPVKGNLSTGEACKGSWKRLADNQGGNLSVQCAGGRSATIAFQYMDPTTGTAVARGTTNKNESVIAWSGLNVPGYLRNVSGMPRNKLVCGGRSIPLS